MGSALAAASNALLAGCPREYFLPEPPIQRECAISSQIPATAPSLAPRSIAAPSSAASPLPRRPQSLRIAWSPKTQHASRPFLFSAPREDLTEYVIELGSIRKASYASDLAKELTSSATQSFYG